MAACVALNENDIDDIPRSLGSQQRVGADNGIRNKLPDPAKQVATTAPVAASQRRTSDCAISTQFVLFFFLFFTNNKN
jgi:hypothetical protein